MGRAPLVDGTALSLKRGLSRLGVNKMITELDRLGVRDDHGVL